jgi:ribosomal small subunit protein bTHX
MGKGDKKTRRGKIWRGTFGKRRRRLKRIKSSRSDFGAK